MSAVAEAVERDVKIPRPDTWISEFLRNDPKSALEFQSFPNASLSLANAGFTAYVGLLLLLSPRFSEWWAADHKPTDKPEIRRTKVGFPDPNHVWELYEAATGK